MAKVIGNMTVPNGKYIKDGEEKTRWLKIGVLLETDNGLRGKIECIPVGVDEGGLWFSVFTEDNQSAQPAPKPAQKASQEPDVPF